MNQSDLVTAVAERAEMTRKDASVVLAAFVEVVGKVASEGDAEGFRGLQTQVISQRPVARLRPDGQISCLRLAEWVRRDGSFAHGNCRQLESRSLSWLWHR